MSKKPATKPKSVKKAKAEATPVVAKPVANPRVVVTKRTVPRIADQVIMLRKVSVVVYAALAVAALYFMNNASQQMRWFYQTKNSLNAPGETILASASSLTVDMPYRVALAIILLLAALFAVLALTKYKASYAESVERGVVPLRWIGIAITAPLMFEVVAMTHGIQDVAVLKLMAGTVFVAALLSWVAERDNRAAGGPAWRVFTIAVISGILPWIVLAGTVAGTAVYGDIQLPWYAYALDAVLLVGLGAIVLNQLLNIKRYKQWADGWVAERNYIVLGLLTKIAFATVLITAFMRSL